MKNSKPALKTAAQEQCGVWLDTTQLKQRAKQKRLARPISKLLNPLVGSGGYNVAVALNFTQTKMEMPKTKQSSISTFFTAQRRVLNKMSTAEVQNMDPVLAPSSSLTTTSALTAPTPAASGTKRRRETDLDFCDSELGVDQECESENVPEAAVWQEKTAGHTPSQNIHYESEDEQYEEIKPPQSKRRLIETSLLAADSQPPPQAWSQDPLFTYSQFSECEFIEQKTTSAKDFSDSEPSFLNSLQSEEAFGVHMDVEARTSTQKAFKHVHSSQVADGKENCSFLLSKSPKTHSTLSPLKPLSNHRWTEPKTPSPRKNPPLHRWRKADREDSQDSRFKWRKASNSPFKQPTAHSRTVADEDSLAMLFTQDSEGFRVIAHRGLQTRSPLKDQSNISSGTVRTSAHKSLIEEEEDEMLFTQDSQGNLVIKH